MRNYRPRKSFVELFDEKSIETSYKLLIVGKERFCNDLVVVMMFAVIYHSSFIRVIPKRPTIIPPGNDVTSLFCVEILGDELHLFCVEEGGEHMVVGIHNLKIESD